MNDSFSFVILCHVLDDLNGTTEKNLTLFRRVERRDMVDDNYVHHLVNIERVLPYICVYHRSLFFHRISTLSHSLEEKCLCIEYIM